ncbi:MAG: WD40 repeat domain-containing protein, partial [Cyanothece sp. SIO1E1]|nr:WD40 repeat domain-containing protein [Cyanothece sp. SIO1E1]
MGSRTMLSVKPLVDITIKRSLSEYITALAWSPVGHNLVISSGAGEVVLWQDFREIILQAASGVSIDALGFSGDGQWLAAAGQASEVMLWQLS